MEEVCASLRVACVLVPGYGEDLDVASVVSDVFHKEVAVFEVGIAPVKHI